MSFIINSYWFAQGGCSGNIISTSNLVGYWKLNGDTLDSSGNGYTLTNYSSNVKFTTSPAKFGQSGIFLTGTTNPTSAPRCALYKDSTGMPNTDSTSASATYMGWFRWENTPSTSEVYLFSMAKSGQRAITFTQQSTNNLRIQIYNGVSGYQQDFPHTPTTGAWTHYAWTQNGGVFTIYINGSSAHTWTNTNNGSAAASIFRVGGHEGTNLSFLGQIDDVSVWTRVLSAAEISTVYASSCPLSGA